MRSITFITLPACLLLLASGCGRDGSTSSDSPPNGTTTTPTESAQNQGAADASVAAESDGWVEVSVESGRFKVMMPVTPIPVRQTAQRKDGPIQFLIHKAQSGNKFFNFNLVTYTEGMITANGGADAVLRGLGTSMMLQKKGSQQEYRNSLDDSDYPGLELKYRFPAGQNSAGNQYPSGYSVHRMYLVGAQVCWLCVDVIDSASSANTDATDTEIQRFLDSIKIATVSSSSE